MCRTKRKFDWQMLALILFITSFRWVKSSKDNCWTNDTECIVQAKLYKTTLTEKTLQEILPLEIDCMSEGIETATKVIQSHEYLMKRFERAFNVELNGCHKGFKWPTFGFEYLPNCGKLIEMKIINFHADAFYELHCPSSTFIQLEILRFERNEIATVTTEALSNLALLKELYFITNALRHVERGAFDNLHFIERIFIESEPYLIIKDANIFEHTNVANLRLYDLKYVTSALFDKLPQTLCELHVEKTAIGVGAAAIESSAVNDTKLSVNNSGLLRNISIIDCALNGFYLNDDYGSIQYLNLSGNSLVELELTINGTKNETMNLKILDLSYNKLSQLPLEWLSSLIHLEKLFLSCNLFKTLPLMTVLVSLPEIQNIDLRDNQLESLTETTTNKLNVETLYRVLIRIDRNPWNCKWLLSFSHSNPELFRIFQYEKFLSQINVNGLECIPEEPKELKTPFNISALLAAERNSSIIPLSGDDVPALNVSRFTLIYGSPYDLKRNQRAEALIIVFMLPVGIATLFLLLYLWIYCQKVFHISFYRKCSLCRRKRKHTNATRAIRNRFDIVRQVPPSSGLTTAMTTTTTINDNEGYELPLNGIAPICNCGVGNTDLTANLTSNKCDVMHHITYVPLPNEEPQKIYEEIIGDDEADNESTPTEVKPDETHVNTIYDHLAFE